MCERRYFCKFVSFTHGHRHLEGEEGSSVLKLYTWRDAISITSPKLDTPTARYKVPVVLCLLDLGVSDEMTDEDQLRQVCTAWGGGGKRLYKNHYMLLSSLEALANSRVLTSGWRRYEEDQACCSLTKIESYGLRGKYHFAERDVCTCLVSVIIVPIMSRHRDFRNLNIRGEGHLLQTRNKLLISFLDELDDDALSDGGEEEITDEEYGKLQTYNIL